MRSPERVSKKQASQLADIDPERFSNLVIDNNHVRSYVEQLRKKTLEQINNPKNSSQNFVDKNSQIFSKIDRKMTNISRKLTDRLQKEIISPIRAKSEARSVN